MVPNPLYPLVSSTASRNLPHCPVTAVCLSTGYVTHFFSYPQLLSTPIPVVLPTHSELTMVVFIIYVEVTNLPQRTHEIVQTGLSYQDNTLSQVYCCLATQLRECEFNSRNLCPYLKRTSSNPFQTPTCIKVLFNVKHTVRHPTG